MQSKVPIFPFDIIVFAVMVISCKYRYFFTKRSVLHRQDRLERDNLLTNNILIVTGYFIVRLRLFRIYGSRIVRYDAFRKVSHVLGALCRNIAVYIRSLELQTEHSDILHTGLQKGACAGRVETVS